MVLQWNQNRTSLKKEEQKTIGDDGIASEYHQVQLYIYRVYKKDVPSPKSLLNSIFCKIMDSNSNQRLILDFRCASITHFVFIC